MTGDTSGTRRSGLLVGLALAAATSATGCGGNDGGTDGGDTDAGEDATADDASPDATSGDGGCGPNTCGACQPGCISVDECVGGEWQCECDCPASDGGADAGMCSPGASECSGGTSCECCPIGGPAQACLCSTTCSSDADCSDPERPSCNKPDFGGDGFCTPEGFGCCWGCE